MEGAPKITFSEAVSKALNGYADYNSRSRRSEYWNVQLAVILIQIIVNIVLGIIGIKALTYIIDGVLGIAFFIFCLPLAVRRLHDIGKTGWFVLLGLIPIIGWIILLIWNCTDSQVESNEYGPSPKYSSPGQGYATSNMI